MSDESSPLLNGKNGASAGGTFTEPRVDGAQPVAPASDGPESSSDVEANSTEPRELKFTDLISVLPLTVGIFLSALDQTIVLAAYASIGNELKQLQKTSWIATAYMLTLSSFQPLYGKLSDIFGRKACLLIAYGIFALGSLLCGLSQTMDQLIISRAIAGIGGGGMTTVVSIIMSDIVPIRQRGTWQGLINIIFATGSSTGAPLGGFLADTIGWRWAFLMQVPAAVLAIVAVSFALHMPHQTTTDLKQKFKRIDFPGAVSLVLTVVFLLVGLDRGGNVSWSDNITIISFALFVVFFAIFASVEIKFAAEPFAPKRIIANPSLVAAYLTNFFGVAAGLPLIFNTSLYLQATQGLSPSKAAWYLLPTILASVIGSLGGGLIIQATGKYYWITVASYLIQVAGTTLTVLTAGVLTNSLTGVCIGLSLNGFGNGTGITTSLIALISNAGTVDQAIATAVSYLFRSLGAVVGLSVASTILQGSLRHTLKQKLEGTDIDDLVRHVRESLDYVTHLDPKTRHIVESSYESAIQVALWFSVAMSICAAVATIFVKEKPLISRK